MPVGTVGKPEPLLRRLFQAIVGIHQETIAEGHRFRISTVATVSTRPSSISFLPLFSFTVFFELTAAGPVGTVGKPEPLLRRLFQAAVGIHQETIAEGHRFRISTVAAVSTGLPSSGFLRFLNLTRYTFGRRTTKQAIVAMMGNLMILMTTSPNRNASCAIFHGNAQLAIGRSCQARIKR